MLALNIHSKEQASVVQTLDSAIHRINRYPARIIYHFYYLLLM